MSSHPPGWCQHGGASVLGKKKTWKLFALGPHLHTKKLARRKMLWGSDLLHERCSGKCLNFVAPGKARIWCVIDFVGSQTSSKLPALYPCSSLAEEQDLSGVIRANRFARFARIGWFARIGNSSDFCESAWRAIKIGVSIANDSRESIRANRIANRPCH